MTYLSPRPTPSRDADIGMPTAAPAHPLESAPKHPFEGVSRGHGPAPRTGRMAWPLAHDDPITHLPILILYPHSRCNCRCLMCDIWRSTTRDELAPEDVARWLLDARSLGIKRVLLSGGEALMHSRFSALCAVLRDQGIGITLLSTGLLLKRHAADVVRSCDEVVVSLDGPAAIHNTIRAVPRAFERLRDGVAALRAASTASGNPVCVSGRCAVHRENFRHLRHTVATAHAIGLERISFLAADVTSTAFNRPDGWDETRTGQIALDAEQLPDLAAEIDALEGEYAGDFESGYIAESPQKLRHRLHQYYAALLGQATFQPNTCNAPWVSSVIEADGTVRPCFFQPSLGNIASASPNDITQHGSALAAVLNSPHAIAWRRGLDTNRNDICKRCVCTLTLRGGPP